MKGSDILPKNYFLNREERSMNSDLIKCNQFAFIVEKHMQGCKSIDELQLGLIKMKLSHGGHYKNGAKTKISPLSPATRKKLKPYIDEYYKNAILHFNEPGYNLEKHIDKFNAALEKLDIDIRKECEEYEGELIVGRIQYYLYPDNYTPPPKRTFLMLGLANNKICDLSTLEQQLEYVKSNYYIDCANFNKYINELINFRTMQKCCDIREVLMMGYKPNCCKLIIEENRIVDVEYLLNHHPS